MREGHAEQHVPPELPRLPRLQQPPADLDDDVVLTDLREGTGLGICTNRQRQLTPRRLALHGFPRENDGGPPSAACAATLATHTMAALPRKDECRCSQTELEL